MRPAAKTAPTTTKYFRMSMIVPWSDKDPHTLH
jgi:hypothetical protein